MTSDDVTPPLFDRPRRPDPMRRAMIENLDQWTASGRAISPATRAALLAQSDAVDLALDAGRATQVSGATTALLALLQGFHLVAEVPGAGGAKLAEFLAEIEQAANGAG